MNDARTITGVCRAASAGSGPGWWHWTCPGPGATRVTATYTLLSDCACPCHTVAGQARLPEVPGPYRSLVPHDRHRPREDAP
ncbi:MULTISPECIES: hypothetical protein [Streptomyces]|uniref:hypothetical protein n=1 Tax=Streptomyces TaxID=1883 RepID=UPI0002FC1A70|nr:MULTISPECIES: hypothetical protein [Streptomyces]